MRNNKYTFWRLLSEKRIVIPIIQRDYAQGREGKEYVRKNFLEQLGKAVFNNNNEEAELDFVYGTESKVTDTIVMFPLDGQQRLTTLWLLHWYVAYKAEKLAEAKEVLKHFSYETRTSSREFCEKLCKLEYQDTNDIVELIKKQTWFYSAWLQDPTIKAMLLMLSGTDNSEINKGEDFVDGIEELFDRKENVDFKHCWDKLTSNECPIHFNFLPLASKELPISDDLYIKMNARGKALTDFENFKADLIDWYGKQHLDTVRFASQIDNDWTDIFWKNKTDDGKIDKIFFAFLNRYFLNSAIIRDKIKTDNSKITEGKEIWSLYGNKSDDSSVKYYGFDLYFKLLEGISDLSNLEKVLNGIKKLDNLDIVNYLPEWAKQAFSGFYFIPEYEKDGITTLTQPQRVLFFAVCCYFEKGDFDETNFRQWMRVACNLIENTTIDSIDAMIGRINLVNSLAQYSHDIYSFLENESNDFIPNATKEQFAEEIAKAKQIRHPQDNNALPPKPNDWKDDKEWNWEEAIKQAENHAFFHGAIRFLFTNEKGEICWSDFDKKWENAQKYFDEDGITTEYSENAILLRSFVKAFDSWGQFGKLYYDGTKYHWKKILTGSSHVYPISILLTNSVDEDKLSNFQSEIKDLNEYQKSIHSEMVNTLLLSKICKECKLVYRPDWAASYALYPDRCRNERKFYIFSKRNEILQDESFICDQRITGINFFWGKDIRFEYKSYTFRWQYSNWVDMYEGDVKLYDKGGEYEQLHTYFGDTSEFCFSDSSGLVEELKRCIETYEKLIKKCSTIAISSPNH